MLQYPCYTTEVPAGLWRPPIFLGVKKLTPNLIQEGGDGMVTYAELFQYTLVILNVILIAIALWKK